LDKLSLSILSSSSPSAGNGRLGVLAHAASKRYVEDGVKLSDAVSKIAKDESLSREQVRRVCEEANVATFRSLFEKQADKNVEFPLADFREVMNVREEPSMRSSPLPIVSGGYVPGAGDADVITALFGEATKLASSEEVHALPQSDLVNLRYRLQGAQDQQRDRTNVSSSLEKMADAEMLELGTQHVMSGGSLGEVLSALAPFAQPSADGEGSPLGSAISKMAEDLISRGLPRGEVIEGIAKTSSAAPNPEHPLVQSFCAWQDAHQMQKVSRKAITVTQEYLDQVEEALGVR
jgi:hypothetical protein